MTPLRRRLITATVMAATFIVVLDSTIANVALPHMQASLGANPESIAWVLTSYILATAVAMPTTGWLADRFGRRTLFTVAVIGFATASALCGIAQGLVAMVVFRFVQGLFGAFLAPMSQAIMYDVYPPERHAAAMTYWGMVVVIGPVVGPVVGGWLTENFDWRWVFYVNVPICVPTAIGAWVLLSDGNRRSRVFDLLGFGFLAVGLVALQLGLDRGHQLDWFESVEVTIEFAVATLGLALFAIHIATAESGLLSSPLLRDRNFMAASSAILVIGGLTVATAALVAPMLQRLYGYPVLEAGLITAPRGLGIMAGMMISGRATRFIDARVPMFTGMVMMAVSLGFMTRFDLQVGAGPIIWTGVLQGVGLGLAVLPLNLLALATLPVALRTEASSFYNLGRSIGGSIAIAVTTALLAYIVQVSHADLAAHLTGTAMAQQPDAVARMATQGGAAIAIIDIEVNRQALMIAYLDDFWAMMWAAIAVLPLVLLLRARKTADQPVVVDAH